MIVDDPRFAAAYRLDDGTEKIFDDLGGLIVKGRERGDLSEADVWVSDFDDEALIEAKTAYFVPTLGVVSPMGHGILAFSDRSRAEATATDLDGEVIRWDAVVDLPVIDGLVGDHHDDHGEHGEHDG
jgi:nitrous oxide reductase accessory protein NosL